MRNGAIKNPGPSAARPIPVPAPAPPTPDPALLRHVLAATLVAALLRLYHLGAQSLWIDEIYTWFSADIGRPLAWAALREDVHGPLYSLLLHLWGGMAGDGEWALRFPSLVFGVLTVPALAWVAARWLGRDTAAPAAWLAAGSPFLVWYSQEARNYTLLMLCVCVASGALLGSWRRPYRRAAGYVLAAWAGLLSNFSFALLAPWHLRAWLAGPPGEGTEARPSLGRRLGGALLVALVLLLLLSPWMTQVLQIWDWKRLHPGGAPATQITAVTEPSLRAGATFHAAALPFAAHAFAVGYTLGPSLRELKARPPLEAVKAHTGEVAAVGLLFGALGLAGLVTLARRRRLTDALLWLVIPALLVSFFALRSFKVFHPRYLAVSAPAFLLLLAAGLAGLPRGWRRAAGALVALVWGISLWNHYFDPAYGKEDYRAALALVAREAGPDEKILAAGAEAPIYYYYRGPLPVDHVWLGFVERPSRLEEELEGKLAGARGTWVVLSRPEDLDPHGVFARTLDARGAGVEGFRFEGVRVWHVTAWSPAPAAAPQ